MGILSRMGRAATALSKYYYPFTWRNKPSIESPINEVHLNHIEDGINEMDNRILILAQDKADASDMANVFIDFDIDDTTGTMTFTRFDGTKKSRDTPMEKIILNCYLEDDNFVLVLADGTKQKVSLAKFIDTYTFTSSDTIRFSVNGKNISADIPDGKITLAKLEPTIMSTIRQYTLDAQTAQGVAEQAAGTAQGWAIGGTGFEDNNAKHYASKSQRYAVGGVEEGDTEDNAKYYCQQAQAAAEQATGAAGFDGTAATVSAIDTQGVAVRKASGTGHVTIENAAEHPILNLNLAGKSEQVSTTGAQLLDLSAINKSVAGAVVNYADGGYSISGTGALTDSFTASQILDIKNALKPGNLILKSELTIPKLYIRIWDGNTVLAEMQGNSTKQITQEMIDNDNVRVECFLYGNTGSTITPGTYHPMLYQSGNGTWEPYTGGKPSPSPEYPQEIVSTDITAVTVTGAQLLDIPSLSTKNYLGVTYSPQPDGTVIATGTSTGTSYIDLRIQEPLPLGDYYISGCPNGGGGDGYQLMAYAVNNGSYKVIGSDIGNGSRFTVTDDNPIAIRIVMRLSISGPLTFKPMLNAGDTALPWEPYQSKTAAITLTEPLRGIGDVRDRIMCRDGVWGIERKIVPLILNGSEAWHQFNTSGSKSFGAADFDSRIKIDSALLCDRLSEDVTNNVWIGKRDNTIATSGSSTRYIRIFLNSTATLDTLKALLSAEPMHVIAERKSPAWEPLPADTQSALNALTTYTGTTHVTVTAGGPEPDVGLEYFGQPGDKVTVQDMCDSFAAPGFDDSGVVEEITSFQSFYDKFVSGMKIRDFFRNLKAGLKFVLHTGQLVNNGLCNEPGKYPLDAAYGRTLLEMIGNTANLPGGAADIVSAIVTQNSNLSQKANSSDLTNVSNVAAAANGKVELSGGPIKIIAYAGDGNWSFQQQYGDGVILSLGMNDTQIFYDYYDGKTWTRKWTK
ncbi:hypothetical protein HMPREF1082_01148 [[Clostridium] clostridioforme 90A7]|nr:hypothetical protein HMPREF1082_01148 [[Clostridium] clostridioforme 90A7]